VQKKSNFQNRDWNKTSVDNLKELHQVALMAFKSQDNMTEMPSKDSGEDALKNMDCKVAPRTQTHSMGDMFRHMHRVQD